MSANNSFISTFGQPQGRVAPPGVVTDMPALGVPTNVPLVRPPDVTTPNPGDMARFDKFNQLAQALGQGGLGGGRLGAGIQAALKKKQAEKELQDKARGQVDATKRAAQTRDIYSDVTKNGWIGQHQNPFYQLGYQAVLMQELTQQYRNDLIQAAQKDPLKDPTERQDAVKQKYMPLLSQARPEVALEYFIKPSADIDKDDYNTWNKAQSENFAAKRAASIGGGIGAAITAEMSLVADKRQSMEGALGNISKSIETKLDTAAATGIPYKEVLDSAVQVVTERARMLPSLAAKTALIDTLRGIKLPGGNLAMNDGEFLSKVAKAQEDIINQHHKQELDALNQEKLEREANADKIIDQMVMDSQAGKLKGKGTDYLPSGGVTGAVDVDAVLSEWSKLSQVDGGNLGEKATDSKVADLHIKANSGQYTPSQIIREGAASGIPTESVLSAAHTASAIQQRNLSNSKASAVPGALIKEFKDRIEVGNLTHAQAIKIPGADYKSAGRVLENTLKSVYGAKYRAAMDQWLEKNPGATPAQVDHQSSVVSEQLWAQASTAQAQFLSGRLSWSKLQGGNSVDSIGYTAPKQTTPARYKAENRWMSDQAAWKEAVAGYKDPKNPNGPLVEFVRTALRKSGMEGRLLRVIRQQPPEYWLHSLESKGFKTWRTPPAAIPKPKPSNKPSSQPKR